MSWRNSKANHESSQTPAEMRGFFFFVKSFPGSYFFWQTQILRHNWRILEKMSVVFTKIAFMKEQILGLLNAYASARVIAEPDSECITWTGRVAVKKGRSDFYPVMKFVPLKSWVSVPRYTWSLVKGELSKYDKLRNNCGNHYCVNPYHYDKKSEVCPNGHAMTEKNSYPFRQEWTNSNGEVLECLAIQCRTCRLEGVNRTTAQKRILGRRVRH